MIAYNSIGLIPGPEESEEKFLKRAEFCLHLKENLGKEIPFKEDELTSPEQFPKAFAETKKLYDINPSWIPIFLSNYKLAPWHGGCAWIFQLEEDSPTAALLQLRKKSFYSKEELIAHELAHASRMAFEEKGFEEILAYQSSPSPLRKWLGPIVQSAWETILFVLLLFWIVIFDLYLIIWGNLQAYTQAMWIKALPIALVGLALFRLFKKQRQFSRCKENLKKITDKVDAVVFRLTDNEIVNFSKWSQEEIASYIEKQDSARWRVIREAYTTNN